MSTMPGVPQSTYRLSFRGQPSKLPLIHHKTLPSLHSSENSHQTRKNNDTQKKSEVTHITENTNLPSVGPRHAKGATRLLLTPPLNKVFQTKFGPMDMQTIEKLYHKRRYQTFAESASKEYTLPMYRPQPPTKTKEEKPDMIALKAQKYEDCRDEWQDAVLWDRIQTRVETMTPKTPAVEKREMTTYPKPVEAKITEMVKTGGLDNVFEIKCPSYAGYVPLCPPRSCLSKRKIRPQGTTTMRTSYCKYPDEEYIPRRYARKGPLSTTVTLTYPYNPYNKVGEEFINVDKEDRYFGLFTGYPEPDIDTSLGWQ